MTATSSGGWHVVLLDRMAGPCHVHRDPSGVHLHLGESRERTDSVLEADLADDGRAALRTRFSPPALVVSRDGVRLLPRDGATAAEDRLDEGDLLLMCSPGVLEHDPAALVALLEAPPASVRSTAVTALLRQLLGADGDGAVAVARRVPEPAVAAAPRPLSA